MWFPKVGFLRQIKGFVLFFSFGYNFLLKISLLFICVFAHVIVQVYEDKRTAYRSGFFPFTVWVLDIKQAVRFGSKLLCPLSHLADPLLQGLKNELCIIKRWPKKVLRLTTWPSMYHMHIKPLIITRCRLRMAKDSLLPLKEEPFPPVQLLTEGTEYTLELQ